MNSYIGVHEGGCHKLGHVCLILIDLHVLIYKQFYTVCMDAPV